MDNGFFQCVSGILVFIMIIGFTLFEAGLVRARNTNDIFIKNVATLAFGCLLFLSVTCHLMFRSGVYINWSLNNLIEIFSTPASPAINTFYQLMLAILSVAIVIGASAERLRLWPYIVFVFVMLSVIYPLQGYWVWGGGFLQGWGFIDRAGAGVVHLTGACASLACVLLLGPRYGKYTQNGRSIPFPGANIPLSVLGALLVWAGSFGFNAGALNEPLTNEMSKLIMETLLNTMIVGSAGIITTMIFSRIFFGIVDITLVMNGSIAALVALSASPHLLTLTHAISLAIFASLNAMIAMYLMDKLKIDDPVGAVAVHGMGGITGLIGIAFFSADIHWSIQLMGICIIIAWSFFTSFIAWYLINKLMGLRIRQEDEYKGLDVIGCGMTAYPEFTSSGWEK